MRVVSCDVISSGFILSSNVVVWDLDLDSSCGFKLLLEVGRDVAHLCVFVVAVVGNIVVGGLVVRWM